MAIEERSRLSRSLMKTTLAEDEVKGRSEEEEEVVVDNRSTRPLSSALSVTN
ncbi:unnamed protein product [Prunus armeniaca]